MLSDEELLELMDRAPGAMHVDLDAVVAEGRRRQRRRRVVVAAAGLAAAVAAGAVGFGLGLGHRTAGPEVPADRATAVRPAPDPVGPIGSATVTAGGTSYAVAVADGVLTVTPGDGSPAESCGLLGSFVAWRVLPGGSGPPTVVGVVPGRADTVVLLGQDGAEVATREVQVAPAGDVTVFAAVVDAAAGSEVPVADVGWSLRGSGVGWALGPESASTFVSVSMGGAGSNELPPYDANRTGPSASPGQDVLVSLTQSSLRLGSTLTATLQQGTVRDPSDLMARLGGTDPDTAAGYSVAQLGDGRTLVWGVLPRAVARVSVEVTGSARAGVPVLASVLDEATAFAVLVEGRPQDVARLRVDLAGPGRRPLELTP